MNSDRSAFGLPEPVPESEVSAQIAVIVGCVERLKKRVEQAEPGGSEEVYAEARAVEKALLGLWVRLRAALPRPGRRRRADARGCVVPVPARHRFPRGSAR